MGKGVDISKKKDKRQRERSIRLQISEDSRVRQACHNKWVKQQNPIVRDLGLDRLELEDDEPDQQQREDDEGDQHEDDQQLREDDEGDQHEDDQQQLDEDDEGDQHEDDQQQHDEGDLPLGGPAPHHRGPAPPGAARGPAPPGAARPGPAPHY